MSRTFALQAPKDAGMSRISAFETLKHAEILSVMRPKMLESKCLWAPNTLAFLGCLGFELDALDSPTGSVCSAVLGAGEATKEVRSMTALPYRTLLQVRASQQWLRQNEQPNQGPEELRLENYVYVENPHVFVISYVKFSYFSKAIISR